MLLTFGNTPVPWTASWSAEERFYVAPCRFADGRRAICQEEAQGRGKPMFGKPHSQRQRQAIVEGLCDLCRKPLKSALAYRFPMQRLGRMRCGRWTSCRSSRSCTRSARPSACSSVRRCGGMSVAGQPRSARCSAAKCRWLSWRGIRQPLRAGLSGQADGPHHRARQDTLDQSAVPRRRVAWQMTAGGAVG
jgi:hypothetical protein